MGVPPNETQGLMPPQPIQPQQPVKPESGYLMVFVAVIVAVVVLVAAIGAYIMLNPGDGGSASPEVAIEGYIANAKNGDVDGMLAYTDVAFYHDDYHNKIKTAFEEGASDGTVETGYYYFYDGTGCTYTYIEILNVSEIPISDMNSMMLAENQDMWTHYDENFRHLSYARITDYKFVSVTTRGGPTPDYNGIDTHTMLFVKIDGGWYLALGSIYDFSHLLIEYIVLSGSLAYQAGNSTPSTGDATFSISITNPSNPAVADVRVTIYASNCDFVAQGNGDFVAAGATVTWTHLVSDDDHIRGGDRLQLVVPGEDISGWAIAVSVDGYAGNIEVTVP